MIRNNITVTTTIGGGDDSATVSGTKRWRRQSKREKVGYREKKGRKDKWNGQERNVKEQEWEDEQEERVRRVLTTLETRPPPQIIINTPGAYRGVKACRVPEFSAVSPPSLPSCIGNGRGVEERSLVEYGIVHRWRTETVSPTLTTTNP